MKSIIPRFASAPPQRRVPPPPTYPDLDEADAVGRRDAPTRGPVPRAPAHPAQRSAAHYDAIEAARAQAMGGGPVAQRDPNLPAGSARWIVASGVGSGAGTTTVAALLSAAYAAHRRYRIVVVDANPVGGALRARLATRGAATAAEIGSVATELTSFARLAPYLDQTAEGAWAVTGAATTAPDQAQLRDAMNALSGFFAVGVADCGPVGHPNADMLLEGAHARLLVAPVTTEGVLSTASALDWLASKQDTGMRSHCTVALVSTVRNPGTDVGWAARLLTGRGARVFPIPYDVALSARRINAASVSDGVAGAVRRLSTELLSRAARAGQNG